MNEFNINDIRHFPEIEKLIVSVTAWGRTWSTKKKSCLFGSHITFISEKEIVIIVGSSKKNDFYILQFKRTKKTDLGNKILKIFKRKRLPIMCPVYNSSVGREERKKA